jgi:predicted RNase H-like nuclease
VTLPCDTVLVAGVDGVKSSWILALVSTEGRVAWVRCASARAVLAAAGRCASVAVDIPIGLPTNGYRVSEQLARSRLGRARSSIFYTPVRAVLGCESYQQACTVSRAASGKAISRQTWGLVPKIRDWDQAAPPHNLIEAHPELSFRAMAPGLDFAAKKSARGAAQRIAALGRWLSVLDALATAPDGVPLEDTLDALACAWTARRFALDEHESLGDETDPVTGRRMRIVI